MSMSYHWTDLLYVILFVVGVLLLLNMTRVLTFWVQAGHYQFTNKERLILLMHIRKHGLRLLGFFTSSSGLLSAISEISARAVEQKELLGLLERLYMAYSTLENKLYFAHQSKHHPIYRNTMALPLGTTLNIEFSAGCRQNAKLVGVDESSLQLRLLDEPEEYREEVLVSFWLADAGYNFTSKILRKKGLHIDVTHSKHIQQYLRRAHPRVVIDEPARFFLLGVQEASNYEIDGQGSGFECVVRDVSEGGAAIIAEGRGQIGLHLKIQFKLNNHDLVICGVIKDVHYDHDYNQSRLHLQADKDMPFKMKEPILAYVYAAAMDSLNKQDDLIH